MKDQSTTKKSFFDNPILRTKVKSANAKIFPEGLVGFFLGPTLALISNSVLSSYLNTYFTNVLNLNNWASTFFTILPVISVIFVVAGNILIGRLMDHVKTRAGKARPILLLAMPLCIIALLVLFVFMPFVDGSEETQNMQMLALILIAIGYNLWFAIAYPFYFTPHSALVNLSTRNSTHRSLLATISNATTLAAMGLCSMILPFFLGLLFRYADATYITETLGLVIGTDAIEAASGGYFTYADTGAIIYDQPASYNAWKVFVIALIIVNTVGIILEYMFTRERITEETMAKGEAAEAEKKKFNDGTPSSLSHDLMRRVRELCGENELQARQVSLGMTQAGTFLVRNASALTGIFETEHSPMDIDIRREANGNITMRFYKPAQSPLDMDYTYTITPDGRATMTACRIQARQPAPQQPADAPAAAQPTDA